MVRSFLIAVFICFIGKSVAADNDIPNRIVGPFAGRDAETGCSNTGVSLRNGVKGTFIVSPSTKENIAVVHQRGANNFARQTQSGDL